MIGYYLTHPQVAIDPATPVPQWKLSEVGRARLDGVRRADWLQRIGRIVSSEERKAVETAAMLGEAIGVGVETEADMGENDRSATGFLAPPSFEAAADAFFAAPHASWNGWERAIDAQERIVGAVQRVLATHDPASPVLFVGHGAVGTLFKCWIGRRPIARGEDQPAGGGNVFAFGLAGMDLLCEWTSIEAFDGAGDGHRNP